MSTDPLTKAVFRAPVQVQHIILSPLYSHHWLRPYEVNCPYLIRVDVEMKQYEKIMYVILNEGLFTL